MEKVNILYSTDPNRELDMTNEEILAFYNEEYLHEDEELKTDIWARDVQDWLWYTLDDRFEAFIYSLKKDIKVLVVADIGRWNGRVPGGDVTTLDDAVRRIISEENDFEFYYDGDTIKAWTANHDGKSYYSLYKVTDEGFEWYDNDHSYTLQKEHEILLNNPKYTERLKPDDISCAW